ncbi:MAG: TrkH family potassium uptake protein [bacterium]|nr:TrkH family potassium uptake protein [bacterium]
MNFSPLFYIVGLLMTVMAGTMWLPLALDWFAADINWQAFFVASSISGLIGAFLSLANRPSEPIALTIPQTFLLTALSWFALSGVAALPFILSYTTTTHTDSFFEAVSAITTTGATVLTGLDFASPGIVLWRSLLQWFGGVGIIMMALTILPILKIGGMQLFRSEFSDRSEKILPRVSQIAKAILSLYLGMTILCGLMLYGAGMGVLDAVCHGMTVIATGGFSTVDGSIGHFDSLSIELICMGFMILSGSTLILYIHLIRGNRSALWKDQQVKAYFGLLIGTTLALTFWRSSTTDTPFGTALRESAFSVTSIVTSSGFTTSDYSLWGPLALVTFFILMLIGGCTGSTAGGMKIFRFQVMLSIARAHLHQLIRPHGVFLPLYNGRHITENVVASVFTFFALYGVTVLLLTLILSMFDLDFMTSLSAAVSSLSNIGPGFGPIIGPSGTFAPLPSGAKWFLMLGMILGRLELATILILFTPKFWQR